MAMGLRALGRNVCLRKLGSRWHEKLRRCAVVDRSAAHNDGLAVLASDCRGALTVRLLGVVRARRYRLGNGNACNLFRRPRCRKLLRQAGGAKQLVVLREEVIALGTEIHELLRRIPW